MADHTITLNWLAIFGATFAAFVFGFLWYGPLFSRPWAKEMGMSMDNKPDPKVMKRAFILQALGLFLVSYVIAHSVQVWRGSAWGVGQDGPDMMYGFFCGLFTWVGFFVPQQFSKIAWEGRSWKLFLINTGHDFLKLQLVSQILAHWR